MDSTVSVVIPVYNAGEFLLETIESVNQQTYKFVELIIVNNCSTEDKTVKLLKQLSANYKVVESSVKGLAQARNDGIKVASGKYILPLDADDLIKPSFIANCVELFDKYPDLTLVRTNVELFGAKKGGIEFEDYSYAKLLARNLMVASSMFKKADWHRVGGYDNNFLVCFEDWEFWINLLKDGGKVGTISEKLFNYRIRRGSMMHSLKMNNLKKARKQIWEKHKAQYALHFLDPTESFEYKYMQDSFANRLGNLVVKPFLGLKLMK